MKKVILGAWGFTVIGLLIAILAVESYFQFFDIIREIDLVTFCCLCGLATFLVFTSGSGLQKFGQGVVTAISALFKK